MGSNLTTSGRFLICFSETNEIALNKLLLIETKLKTAGEENGFSVYLWPFLNPKDQWVLKLDGSIYRAPDSLVPNNSVEIFIAAHIRNYFVASYDAVQTRKDPNLTHWGPVRAQREI